VEKAQEDWTPPKILVSRITQSVIRPLVRVKKSVGLGLLGVIKETPDTRDKLLMHDENKQRGLLAVMVPVNPVVSKPNVTVPVILVPNFAASAGVGAVIVV
jgi:hypothetical protein